MYAWSLRSLTRRLQYFGIQFTDYSVDIDDVREAVEKEMNSPGSLLGYRALHQKIREVHGLSALRNLVYAMMTEVNLAEEEKVVIICIPKVCTGYFRITNTITFFLNVHNH